MGTTPKEIETRGVAVFNELVINDFHVQYGHELRADAFIKLKTESGTPENAAPGGWLAVQVKTTAKRTASWARKMKHVLRYEREGLHNMALVGVSLDPEDPVFIHVVHRCNNYDCFSTKDATWNTPRSSAAARLRELCTSGATPLNESPTSRFVYSQATLIECEAREDFKTLLRESPVSYEAAPTEFTVVDGILSLNGVPGVGYRVQEKVLAWRRENGKPLGLRVCLRRYCPLSLGSPKIGHHSYGLSPAHHTVFAPGPLARITGRQTLTTCCFTPATATRLRVLRPASTAPP